MIESSYEFDSFPSKTSHAYTFTSRGRTGAIIKVIKFSPLDGGRFNLGMADVRAGQLDGKSNSDNFDSIKVFNTVALIVLNFVVDKPRCQIQILGSDAKRSRLYHAILTHRKKEIGQFFSIFGFVGSNFPTEFDPELQYDGFLLIKKTASHV